MMRATWLGVLSLVVGVTGTAGAGCAADAPPDAQSPMVAPGTTSTAGAQVGLAEDDQASVELMTHHRHHHGGFVGFIMAAVETIDLTPEQQSQVTAIQASFKAKVEPVRLANGAVMAVLADGLTSGALDQARLDAALANVGATASMVHAATADALNQLHGVLRPEQRQALVDKIEAHWTIWKESNAGDQAADNQRPDGHVAHLAKEIGLSDDQVTKTRANLAMLAPAVRGPFDPAAGEMHMKAFAAAFAGDAFDAKTLTTSDAANKGIASWGAARMVRFYQALLPVLTPDQRAKVAASLREHANEP